MEVVFTHASVVKLKGQLKLFVVEMYPLEPSKPPAPSISPATAATVPCTVPLLPLEVESLALRVVPLAKCQIP